MITLYTILSYLIQPLIWLYLLLRSQKSPNYRERWAERYGWYGHCVNKIRPNGIVLHSVSLGETITSIPLIHALLNRYPTLPITITTMTPSGSDFVRSSFGKTVYHVYLPYDLPSAINRFLQNVKPKLVIIMETELWPNIIYTLRQNHIPLIIVNARLSKYSTIRYQKIGSFMRKLLQYITLIVAQNSEDAKRFLKLGLNKSQLVISGSLKFDTSLTNNIIIKTMILRREWAAHRPVWIAGSTHEGEEVIILNVHRRLLQQFSNLLLILVPRQPERFHNIYDLTNKFGFISMLRSSGEVPSDSTQVIIGDTMGELIYLYGIADIAFVGGSLVKHGGHNPLEPALHAIPVLTGPHIWNFKNICMKLYREKGLIIINNASSMEKALVNLLQDNKYRRFYTYNAIKVLSENQGSVYSIIKLLEPYLLPLIND
ncbi:lipid IV(A) 3-deoxy-D-manno-octulosonic acid transferase [Pantoea sp. Mhis]|uniref:lipid IV(A) 3-deoxy-D-manno-octulosonic acid transferase n=1 Tax=Pantoea sp. Mhis TaxID=2576759 RepID=UPI00135C5149|nr:lipid IV(A) 3-deoxy-D-manno-octulosonic acid transferase [Pantoea sp. Mhis]MXP56652.1 3-deoxy-D-manno-octulosonic acid transferase [Pantoea sp. Mhis]